MTNSKSATAAGSKHRWRFQRYGGVLQAVLDRPEDLAHLDTLDLKYWLALAMPVKGVECDEKTLQLLDTDKDGRIRPPELIAAVQWACAALNDPGLLLTEGDAVPIAAICDTAIAASVRRILKDLGRADAAAISMADVADQGRVMAAARFNGDGVVTAEAAGDEDLRKAVGEIVGALGPVTDRGGQPGVDKDKIEAFFAQAAALLAWSDRPAADPAIIPLGAEATAAAAAAVGKARAKVEDYFARCRLAAFDPNAANAVNRTESDYRAIAVGDLSAQADAIAALPLAPAAGGRPLPLDTEKINPAWVGAVAQLRAAAIAPLLGDRTELSEKDWRGLTAKLSAWENWMAAKPATPVESLGLPRLRELLAGDVKTRLLERVAQDLEPAAEFARFADVEKLVRYRRDLRGILANFVNFSDFYRRRESFFQAGTLYMDSRACRLCVEVADSAKHAALAGYSGAFLAYCDIARAGEPKRSIAALFTDGDSDNLIVGRNGVFYDRKGRDWDATLTRVVSSPISIREAFWLPYKKLIRMIEDHVAKRAQAADAAATAKMGDTAAQVAGAAPAAPPAPAKKFDLGAIALIGAAIGGLSALIGGLLQALFGLGWWLPVGIAGILLLISGPSMLLAALKLHRRNLGPLLDSNGWAINTRARINVAFGAALTEVAAPPLSAIVRTPDPFAPRRAARPVFWIALILAVIIAALLYFGALNRWIA